MPYGSLENSDKNTLPYLGKELVVSSLLSVLALLLVGHLHVVEAIKRPDAQKLTPKEHKITTRIEKDRISAPHFTQVLPHTGSPRRRTPRSRPPPPPRPLPPRPRRGAASRLTRRAFTSRGKEEFRNFSTQNVLKNLLHKKNIAGRRRNYRSDWGTGRPARRESGRKPRGERDDARANAGAAAAAVAVAVADAIGGLKA